MRAHRLLPSDEQIKDMFIKRGMTAAEIGQMYGVKAKSVNHHIRRLGLRERCKSVRVEENTHSVIAYMAQKNNTTPSDVIQAVLDVMLDKHIDELERILEVA